MYFWFGHNPKLHITQWNEFWNILMVYHSESDRDKRETILRIARDGKVLNI